MAGNQAFWIPYANKTHTDLMVEDVLLYGTTSDMVECLITLIKFIREQERTEEDLRQFSEKVHTEIFAERKEYGRQFRITSWFVRAMI